MKLTIKLLISSLLLLCIASIKVVRKTKTKAKTQVKSIGSGSWATGYDCAEGLATGVPDSGEFTVEAKGKFYATKLENPVTEYEKIGWVFEMAEEPKGRLAKIMFKAGEGKNWYLPYRYISRPFAYWNRTFNSKYLIGWATNDSNETIKLAVYLPYKTLGWFINDDEGNKIVTLINSHATKNRSRVHETIGRMSSLGRQYIDTKHLSEASSSEQMKKQLAEGKEKLEALKKLIDSAVNKSKELQTTLNDKRAKLVEKEEELSKKRNESTRIENELINLEKSITALSSSKEEFKKKATIFKAEMDLKLNQYKAEEAILQVEAVQRKTQIAQAREELIAAKLTENGATLNKIFPA
jgi:hypothetical protein